MQLVKYISNVHDFCKALSFIQYNEGWSNKCNNYSFDMQNLAKIIYSEPSLAQLDCGYSLLYCKYSDMYTTCDTPLLLIGNTLMRDNHLSFTELEELRKSGRNTSLIDHTELLYQVVRSFKYKGNDFLGKLGIDETHKETVMELMAGFVEHWRYYAISAKNGVGTVADCPWIRIVVTTHDNSRILYDIIDPTVIKEVYKEYKSELFKDMGEVINKQLGINSTDCFKVEDILDIRGNVKMPTDKAPNTGKKKCDILKSIRSKLGDKLGISVNTKECTHRDTCSGTCPACDAEAAKLSAKLLEGNTDKIDSIDTGYWGGEDYVDGEMQDFGESGFENLEAPDGIDIDIEDTLEGEAMPFPDEDDTQSN